jgi:hypothetical protein
VASVHSCSSALFSKCFRMKYPNAAVAINTTPVTARVVTTGFCELESSAFSSWRKASGVVVGSNDIVSFLSLGVSHYSVGNICEERKLKDLVRVF